MEDHIIYPGETAQLNYWTRKWGVSRAELHEAIMQTGSLRAWEIKEHLKKKRISFSLSGILQFIRLHL
ncbi:MAG: hypothetical protein JWO44_2384 [Bacteroidetes bacterium]|jgi:hypothetical protein|nr:hypothetical protein [Bacteroidota bacterium]